MADTPIALALDDEERIVLAYGLNDWLGPARGPTAELAIAFGFEPESFWDDINRLFDLIWRKEPLTKRDWVRALLAAEFAFIDTLFGSGHDWRFSVGVSDEASLVAFRRLQKKINFFDTAESLGNIVE